MYVFSKNSLNQYTLRFCCKNLVVLWLAQTFSLESLKCTIKGKSIYWGYKYNNQGHSCQQLLQIVVPLIRHCRSLGLCFFGPPFLVGEIAGPLFKAIRSSFYLMGHSSSTIFLSMLVAFFFSKNSLNQYILYSSWNGLCKDFFGKTDWWTEYIRYKLSET